MTRRMKNDRSPSTPRTGLSRREMLRCLGLGGLALAVPGSGFLDRLVSASEAAPMHVENLALRFAKYYQPIKVQVKPRIPAYPLPLDPAKIANFKQAAPALGLSSAEPSLKK